MFHNNLSKELAEEVYTLLVNKVKVSEKWREDCVNYLYEESMFNKEYRLLGSLLGFGGKIHWDGKTLRVSYYSEDHTEERKQLANSVNKELKKLLTKCGLENC